MPSQVHLEALKEKHKQVEADLADALLHPSSSEQEIAELKHKRLALKDEITALEAKIRSALS